MRRGSWWMAHRRCDSKTFTQTRQADALLQSCIVQSSNTIFYRGEAADPSDYPPAVPCHTVVSLLNGLSVLCADCAGGCSWPHLGLVPVVPRPADRARVDAAQAAAAGGERHHIL